MSEGVHGISVQPDTKSEADITNFKTSFCSRSKNSLNPIDVLMDDLHFSIFSKDWQKRIKIVLIKQEDNEVLTQASF